MDPVPPTTGQGTAGVEPGRPPRLLVSMATYNERDNLAPLGRR